MQGRKNESTAKREVSRDHRKENNSKGPNINAKTEILVFVDDFRGHIGRGPASMSDFLVGIDRNAESEINELDIEAFGNQNIFKFDVMMHNIFRVAEGHRFHQLLEYNFRFFLFQFSFWLGK